MASPFVTSREIAADLGVSVSVVYSLLSAQVIPSVRIGRNFYVHKAEFQRWLSEGRTNHAPGIDAKALAEAFVEALASRFTARKEV